MFLIIVIGMMALAFYMSSKKHNATGSGCATGSGDAQSYVNQGDRLLTEKRHEEALRCFDRAFELGLKSKGLFLSRAACLEALDWKLDAIDDFGKAIELDPSDCNVWFQRSIVKNACGDNDGAVSDCTEAIRLSRSEQNRRNYDYTARQQGYESVTDFYELYLARMARLSGINAKIGLSRKQAEEAKARGRRTKHPIADKVMPNERDVQYYLRRGSEYSDGGNHDAAIHEFDKAIKLSPNNANAYCERGKAYLEKNDDDNAIKDYDKAIELDPKCVCAYVQRGFAYDLKGDYDTAILNFDKAIELAPGLAGVYSSRGDAYGSKKDYSSAIRDYDKAIELGSKEAHIYYNRGVVYLKNSDYSMALRHYAKAAELNSKYTVKLEELKNLLRQRGLDKVIGVVPN